MALLTEHADQDALGGGRSRQTIAIKRIAYRRDGNLRRITNALANTGDPALSIGVSELAQFRVADRLAGQSPMLHFGKGVSNVRLTPLATNNVAAVVAGNVVTYPEAWGNADLKLAIGGHILRKEILLRAGHPSSFAFRITNHAGFNIDTLSTPDFRILQPSLEGPSGQHIPLVWGVSSSGGKYILTVTLPPGDYAGWVVDPTLVLQPDATDGTDNEIYFVPYAGTNYGTETLLGVCFNSNDSTKMRTLLKFNLDSVPDTFNSASLGLYFQLNYGLHPAFSSTFRIYRQLRAWTELGSSGNNYAAGLAWQTQGGFGASDCEQADVGNRAWTDAEATGEFKAFPLTPVTKAGLDLGNGWLIKSDDEVTAQGVYFSSSDHATAENRPRLTIEYTLPAAGMSRAPIASWCH